MLAGANGEIEEGELARFVIAAGVGELLYVQHADRELGTP